VTTNALRQIGRAPGIRLILAATAALVLTGRDTGQIAVLAQAPPCSIACENAKPGNPPSEWNITGAGDPGLQGFATDISVNQGQTVAFKINTSYPHYRLDIYRMGYYGGNGARKVAHVLPFHIAGSGGLLQACRRLSLC